MAHHEALPNSAGFFSEAPPKPPDRKLELLKLAELTVNWPGRDHSILGMGYVKTDV